MPQAPEAQCPAALVLCACPGASPFPPVAQPVLLGRECASPHPRGLALFKDPPLFLVFQIGPSCLPTRLGAEPTAHQHRAVPRSCETLCFLMETSSLTVQASVLSSLLVPLIGTAFCCSHSWSTLHGTANLSPALQFCLHLNSHVTEFLPRTPKPTFWICKGPGLGHSFSAVALHGNGAWASRLSRCQPFLPSVWGLVFYSEAANTVQA